MDKLKMHSPDLSQQNLSKIKALFPNCIIEIANSDGKKKLVVDFELLKQELSESLVDGPQERYRLDWPGKSEALLNANSPIAKTLRPCREDSINFDSTKNLFIEGDNLEALKLLQETYLGKIKLIYIDPPYNTGSDLIYDDDFSESSEEYLFKSMQENALSERLTTNMETNGRFHSDWLSMIYPRLKLARNLLCEEGSIFISIDENEVANLRKICDEVFGEQNYASTFLIKSNPRGSQSTAFSATVHEYLLCYVKNSLKHKGFLEPLTQEMISEYNLEDSNGRYRLLGLRLRGGSWRREQRPLLFYPIYVNPNTGKVALTSSQEYNVEVLPIKPSTGEDGTWRWSRQKLEDSIDEILAKEVKRDEKIVWDIFQKDYLNSKDGEQRSTKPKTIWDEKEMNYQNGTVTVRELFGKNVFDFPKPVELIQRIIEMSTSNDDTILDFFAGSSTTAHSVLKMNSIDGGKRKFIMVQVPVPCHENSEAFKAGYSTISEISRTRIKLCGEAINNLQRNENEKIDAGFRCLKIDTSNFKDVYYSPNEVFQGELNFAVESMKPDRSEEDLLFQVMLDLGLELTVSIDEKKICDKKVFSLFKDGLLACFDKNLNSALIGELASKGPLKLVLRDDAFENDAMKINTVQIFRQISPHTEIKTI